MELFSSTGIEDHKVSAKAFFDDKSSGFQALFQEVNMYMARDSTPTALTDHRRCSEMRGHETGIGCHSTVSGGVTGACKYGLRWREVEPMIFEVNS